MPTVGEVNVNIKGNADGLTKAGRDASASLKSLQQEVKFLQSYFQSGRINQAQFAAAMQEVRRQTMGLGSSLSAMNDKGLTAFNRLMQQTAPTVTRVGLSINSLRGPLATLAAQSIGASGAVGTLGSMLLQLSGGAGIAIGAIGIIGGLAAVMNKLGEDTKKAHKAYEDYLESLRITTPLAIVGRELNEAEEKLAKLSKERPVDQFGDDSVARALVKQKVIVEDLRKQYKNLQDAMGQGHGNTVKKFAEEAAEAFKKLREEAIKSADAVAYAARITEVGLLGGQRPQAAFKSGAQNLPLINQGAFNLNNMGRPADNSTPTVLEGSFTKLGKGAGDMFAAPLKRALANLQRAAEVVELGNKIGDTIGSAMARGIGAAIFDGSKSMGAIIKAVFRQIFEEILKEIIKMFAVKIGLQIASALIPGGGFLGGVLKSTAGAVANSSASNIQINVPPAQSPLTAARDAQWLGTLSESLRGLASINGLPQQAYGRR